MQSISASEIHAGSRCNPPPEKCCSRAWDLITRIFQTAVMAVQYPMVQGSITLRQWYIFSSAIHWKSLEVSSRNIATPSAWIKSLKTSIFPRSKSNFQHIGRGQGLRITHDITLFPASGHCLGMSMEFLAGIKEEASKGSLLASAQVLRWGANDSAVRVQAIYEALLGSEGEVKSEELKFFKNMLLCGQVNEGPTAYPQLRPFLESFLNQEAYQGTLRQFIFEGMEKRNLKITPDIYALVLELDTFWHQKQTGCLFKNDALHFAVSQAAASCLQLKLERYERFADDLLYAKRHLENLPSGKYLLMFSNHTYALVKTADTCAIFDPNQGLGPVPAAKQSEAISRLLDFNSSDDSVSLMIIAVKS